MPTAYSYIRVSHQDSANSGLSPGSQLDQCRMYYGRVLMPKEAIWWGMTEIPEGLDLIKHDGEIELLYDPAVSARHVPFLNRKGGSRLNDMLQPGDHVIFAHLDRGFRAVLDFSALIDVWKSRNITVHFADMGVDVSTPHGMLVANIMAAVAQGQSDMQERAIMAEIVRLRDEKGRTWQTISDSVERRLCEYDGRQFRESTFFKRKWGPSKCRRAYIAYKRILEEEGGRLSKNARSK